MQYMGGKSHQRFQIVRFLKSLRSPEQLYIEPFVGACNTFSMMDNPKIGIDIHEDLILMWNEVQNGWTPPDSITEDEYYFLKYSEPSALRGFTGFGCSYAGKWFGGYARRKDGYNYSLGSKTSLLHKSEGISNAVFLNCDYRKLTGITNCLIYCDPPYSFTTGFKDKFDSREFWNFAREVSRNNIVVISEMNAPKDFAPVEKISKKHGMYTESEEFLFMYGP